MPERTLSIPAERIEKWLSGFAARHGDTDWEASPEKVTVTAADGAVAECEVPFPPLSAPVREPSGPLAESTNDGSAYGGLIQHVLHDRRVGVLLVRRGGFAAGVFEGRTLTASKVGSRHVQGRTAAGGQSQQRFARRRDKQAREAFEAAADVAARILAPVAGSLDAVCVGGDRPALDQVLVDPRLSAVRALVVPPHLNVPNPKRAILETTPVQFRAVRIALTEPE